MMRSKLMGKRYLAGFVIAAAMVHLSAVILATSIGWDEQDIVRQSLALLMLGLVPVTLALLLARKAWLTKDETSAAYSSAGLVVLLMALIVSHLGRLGR